MPTRPYLLPSRQRTIETRGDDQTTNRQADASRRSKPTLSFFFLALPPVPYPVKYRILILSVPAQLFEACRAGIGSYEGVWAAFGGS